MEPEPSVEPEGVEPEGKEAQTSDGSDTDIPADSSADAEAPKFSTSLRRLLWGVQSRD